LRCGGALLGYRLASTSAGGPAPRIAAWLSGTYHSSYCERYRDLRGDCARRHRNDDRLNRQGHLRRNQSR
jgi:hypothetical protein